MVCAVRFMSKTWTILHQRSLSAISVSLRSHFKETSTALILLSLFRAAAFDSSANLRKTPDAAFAIYFIKSYFCSVYFIGKLNVLFLAKTNFLYPNDFLHVQFYLLRDFVWLHPFKKFLDPVWVSDKPNINTYIFSFLLILNSFIFKDNCLPTTTMEVQLCLYEQKIVQEPCHYYFFI